MHHYQYHVIIKHDNISKESSLIKTYYINAKKKKKGEQCPLSNTPGVTKTANSGRN